MKVVLVGYGSMGRQIEEEIVRQNNHEVVHVAYKTHDDALTLESLKDADVAVDFSHGSLMKSHIGLYCEAKVNAVVGTTNWQLSDEMRQQIDQAGIGVIVGSNFSAGLQVFLQLVRDAARRFNTIAGYDVYGLEVHHTGKSDSPSGTAKTIANTIIEETSTKQHIMYDRVEGQIESRTLHFASIRGGIHSGMHEVTFDSDADSITLRHNAHNRQGFVLGAVAAIEHAMTRSGCVLYEELFEDKENEL